MDIFKFINSRDIREHLKSINYCFSSLEAAWLIWQSKHTTLKEKHEAWRELIEKKPDCEIEERPNTNPQPSLHIFLRKLMELENRCIGAIKTNEPYSVFSYKYSYPKDLWSELFPDFMTCLSSALDEYKTSFGSDDITDCHIRIQKRWVDGSGNYMESEVTPKGEVVKILNHGKMAEEEPDLIIFGLDGLWFDFPTPFEKGDIICDPDRQDKFGLEDGPCVIEHEIPWRSGVEHWKEYGDNSDMVVHGIFQSEDGTVYKECASSYMDFEHYRNPLTGKRRILQAISNYLGERISLELLLNAYHTIIAQEYAKDARPLYITKEGLELAGILERKNNE